MQGTQHAWRGMRHASPPAFLPSDIVCFLLADRRKDRKDRRDGDQGDRGTDRQAVAGQAGGEAGRQKRADRADRQEEQKAAFTFHLAQTGSRQCMGETWTDRRHGLCSWLLSAQGLTVPPSLVSETGRTVTVTVHTLT